MVTPPPSTAFLCGLEFDHNCFPYKRAIDAVQDLCIRVSQTLSRGGFRLPGYCSREPRLTLPLLQSCSYVHELARHRRISSRRVRGAFASLDVHVDQERENFLPS
jgi:hypothetical protein